MWTVFPVQSKDRWSKRMGKTAKQWKDFYRKEEFQKQYCDPAEKLGMECTSGRTSFRLWSPVAEEVQICFTRTERPEVHLRSIRCSCRSMEYGTMRQSSLFMESIMISTEDRGRAGSKCRPLCKSLWCERPSQYGGGFEKTDPVMWESDKAPEKKQSK